MTENQRKSYISKRAKHGRSESRTKSIQDRWNKGIPKKKMLRSSKKGLGQKSSYSRNRKR